MLRGESALLGHMQFTSQLFLTPLSWAADEFENVAVQEEELILF